VKGSSVLLSIGNMLQVVVYNVKLIGCLSSAANIDLSIVWGSGISPIVYVFMKRDLQTLSQQNIVFKYADDTTVLVRQHTDIDVRDEFNNVKQWACNNKLILNRNKTKEIVFKRPRALHFHIPLSEWLDCVKVLGVLFRT